MEAHTDAADWADSLSERVLIDYRVANDDIPQLVCELRKEKKWNVDMLKAGKSGCIELANWEKDELKEEKELCRVMLKKCRQSLDSL